MPQAPVSPALRTLFDTVAASLQAQDMPRALDVAQRDLDELTLAQAQEYVDQGQFPEGSMLPKIEAAMRFTGSAPGRRTLVTSLDKLVEGLRGETGTWIVA